MRYRYTTAPKCRYSYRQQTANSIYSPSADSTVHVSSVTSQCLTVSCCWKDDSGLRSSFMIQFAGRGGEGRLCTAVGGRTPSTCCRCIKRWAGEKQKDGIGTLLTIQKVLISFFDFCIYYEYSSMMHLYDGQGLVPSRSNG